MLGIDPGKRLDFWLIMLSFPIAAVVSVLINASYFAMGFVYMGFPVVLLAIREGEYLKKYIIEAIPFTLVSVGVFDYLGTISHSWSEQSIFSVRFLGTVPYDTFVWGFVYVLFSLLFYSYFFDSSKIKQFSTKVKKPVVILTALSAVFAVIYIVNKEWLVVNYLYAYLSLLYTVVLGIGYYKYPHLYPKIALIALIGLLPGLLHEFSSLHLGHWIFHEGQHLGYIRPFGYLIPFEEIYWLIVVVPCFIILHEVYADDRKN